MRPATSPDVLLVGHFDAVHVGAHLAEAASALGCSYEALDAEGAFSGNRWLRALSWRFRGHRPLRLHGFSRRVARVCQERRPALMVSTGLAPITRDALRAIGRTGTTRVSYLTDDPWNPAHRARWFMDALPEYDAVFSTRRANLEDLHRRGCRRVAYLPFAYAPRLHYFDPPSTGEEVARFSADVAFAGGADADRVPLLGTLIAEGFDVALYGGYWQRYPETKRMARGHADATVLRKAMAGAKVALCLVRRANRDGSAMRTFEAAAMGACMLAEDTAEHREILGDDGEAVVYFRTAAEMVERLRWLLSHEQERRRLGAAVRARMAAGRHTYADRLQSILQAAPAAHAS